MSSQENPSIPAVSKAELRSILLRKYLSRILLMSIAFLFLGIFIILPLFSLFVKAFEKGFVFFFAALGTPAMRDALLLTLSITTAAVFISTSFGVIASWLIARYQFRGRSFLTTIMDIPLTLSPVVIGVLIVLLYGKHGSFGPFFESMGLPIVFNWPGLLLTNLFIILPYVIRELTPTLQEKGVYEEEAAATLGARFYQIVWHITLPNITWALLYGLMFALMRSAGEFGASSVVSGFIRGKTATLPIYIDILYNEYMSTEAFAAASLFVCFSAITLIARFFIRKKKES